MSLGRSREIGEVDWLCYNSLMMSDAQQNDKNRLISLAEAAEFYGFDHKYLSELAKKGRLKATKVGYFWTTTPADVEKYIKSRQKRGAYRNDIQLD